MMTLTLSLGFWQVERLHWKRALLAEIDRGEAVGAVPLPDQPRAFSRVIAEGVFAADIARYGAEVRATAAGAAMGAHIVAALHRPDGLPIVVDRGWAPVDAPVSNPSGPVRVEGYIRPIETGTWSSASDDPEHKRFFTLNPGAIGASLGESQVAPYTLVILGPAGGYPEPATTLPRPPNDHLSYAITWFSLSAILAIVFAVFALQTRRKGASP